jgi:GH25 family lysozyme M1 (1,4-beta-N-acetylmuramidase)
MLLEFQIQSFMKKKLHCIVFLCICAFSARTQTILGVDVSSYEGSINWLKVKAAGYTFAFAKATEGTTVTDSYFVGNQVNGTAAGMAMGAYHFARPENNSALAEANYFLSVAGPYIKACHLPPVLDVEDPNGSPALATFFTSAQLTAWVQTWMSTVQNATGIAPIIYIGPHNAAYMNSSINTYGLWIDDYNSSPTAPPPNIGVWTNWEFKQYSWTGTVPGINAPAACDMDVFHGTMNQFNTLIGCNAVLADFTSNVKSVCPGTAVTFTDKSSSTGSISGWKWTFTGGTPDTSSMQNPVITYNSPGVYSVKEVVTSSAGKDSVSYQTYINVATAGSLPLVETFQASTFPPAGWSLNLPNTYDSIWHQCTTTGKNSSQCMYFPANCGQTGNITGERQQIHTPNFNFSGTIKPRMWFDVAYEPSKVPTYSDTLVIYYSTDCGGTWNSLYSKGGMTLCTTGSTTGAGTDTAGSHGKGCFVPPNTSAWRTDSVNIAVVSGMPSVMFSFENRSGWGNIMYLDNINITNAPTGIQDMSLKEGVKIYPNPNKGSFSLALPDQLTETVQLRIYDLLGQSVYDAYVHGSQTEITLDVKPGVYIYRLQTENGNRFISSGKLIIE